MKNIKNTKNIENIGQGWAGWENPSLPEPEHTQKPYNLAADPLLLLLDCITLITHTKYLQLL